MSVWKALIDSPRTSLRKDSRLREILTFSSDVGFVLNEMIASADFVPRLLENFAPDVTVYVQSKEAGDEVPGQHVGDGDGIDVSEF
jgi:hypothetical protein